MQLHHGHMKMIMDKYALNGLHKYLKIIFLLSTKMHSLH